MTAKILFIYSMDYGERVNIDLFCHGEDFDTRHRFPVGHPALNTGGHAYHDVEHLLSIARDFRPDVVVLASAYLMTVNNILSPDQLRILVNSLLDAGIVVATTDPWMGFWRHRAEARFNLFGIAQPDQRHLAENKFRQLQSLLDELFEPLVHLYATPYVDSVRRSYSFFNGVNRDQPAIPTGQSEVVMVMSNEDYTVQKRQHGGHFKARFQKRIARLMQDYPDHVFTLLGPEVPGRLLSEGLPGARFRAPGTLDLPGFRDRLEQASLVIYWNLVSTSLLYPYYGHRQIGYLDKGHQAELSDGFAQHIVDHVYQGVDPTINELDGSDFKTSCYDYLRRYPGQSPRDIVNDMVAS